MCGHVTTFCPVGMRGDILKGLGVSWLGFHLGLQKELSSPLSQSQSYK